MIVNSHTKKILYDDSPNIDAFSRLRVSNPYSTFDTKHLWDKNPLFWDESIGGNATSVHSQINAAVEMSVSPSASDFVIRQTKVRFNYQPGKSQMIFLTFFAEQKSGITQRLGYFSGTGTNNLTANNGIFFQMENNNLSWNIAKNGTTTESVSQSNWNIDKLDGTGKSGITLNLDATQILIIDFEWLGTGRVRVGFIIDGVIKYCHYFNHANKNPFNSVYMSTPNLPLRYDITSDGTNSGNFSHICGTVISEGGLEKTGVTRSIDNGVTFVTTNTIGASYALLGMRLKSDHIDSTVDIFSLSAICKTSDFFRWSLRINPTVAGTFTFNSLVDSTIEYAVGDSTNTLASLNDGIVIASGYASNQTRQVEVSLVNEIKIGSNIDGTRDIMVLAVSPLTSGIQIAASINFRELI
jgi:hypothetical protein